MHHFILIALVISTTCFAADFTVPPNQTTTQTLPDDGDRGTIESNGTIDVVGNNAVRMNNNNQTLISSGRISITGNSLSAVRANGNNAHITNYGLITASGSSVFGIETTGTSIHVINTGTINLTTTDPLSSCIGVTLIGGNSSLTNTGLITVNSTVSNSLLSGVALSENSTFINEGTVTSTDSAIPLILSVNPNTQVINNGGILAAPGRSAILYNGTNPSLSLLINSKIAGSIFSLSPLDLSAVRGLNLYLELTSSTSIGTLNVDAPHNATTRALALVDPTGFSMQVDMFEDLTDAISGNIYPYQRALLTGCCPCQGIWLQGIGSYRQRSLVRDYWDWQKGGILGYSRRICNEIMAGIYGGAAYGQGRVANSTDIDSPSYFAGASCETYLWNMLISTSLAAGYNRMSSDRTVMANLAPGGISIAHAKAEGWFITPELFLSKWFCTSRCYQPVVSLGMRYAGAFYGHYREEGSQGALSIDNRHIDLLKVVGELGMATHGSIKRWVWNILPYIGVAGRFQIGGNTFDSELLGLPLNFDVGGPHNLAELILGVRGSQPIWNSELTVNAQTLWDTDKSFRIFGEIGLNYFF